MTTYWDAKSARTVAAADAQTRLAEAEAVRAETALRIETQRLQLEETRRRDAERARAERRERKAKARKQRQAEKAARRKERRARLADAARAVAVVVSQRVPLLVGAVAMGAPIAIAWDGQLEFGDQVMKLGALAVAVPVALEGSAWYLAWLTHKALEAIGPTGRLRAWTWALALVAAAMNVWHGTTTAVFGDDGMQVGIVRGLASLLGVGLWELTVMARRQRKSGRSLTELRTALWRRVRYPRLSWQAASIAAARGAACSLDAAWQAAWIDRYGVGPDASRRERRLTARILRGQARADRKAARKGELSMVGGVVVGRPIPIVTPVDRPALTPVLPTPAASIDTDTDTGTGTVIDTVRIDRVEPRSIELPSPALDRRARRSIEAPKPSIDRPKPASVDRRQRRSIELPAGDAPAPRRSIEEHRQILQTLIGLGQLGSEPTAEEIRTTLRCAPKTAAALRDELLAGEVAA
ncbi:DUF2637 domain-containing protein [Nonomuraea sp. NPDC047529]|uniref:DUF2637 domain-containing protein n=1 Tax=Nonomuraea sp. NPDC047529 TaxID=3155623 RepID=UPI0033F47AAE